MLGILKVNAGVSSDGIAEFTLTIADAQDRVFEVQIDDVAYSQLIGVIEETNGREPDSDLANPVQSGNGANGDNKGLAGLSPEKRAALANLLTQKEQQETIEEQPSTIGLVDVGFDYDYSATEDEEDPGELLDDEYVEPI